MNRVLLKKSIHLEALPFAAPVVTRDGLERIQKVEILYTSVKVTYTATWDGDSNRLLTYVQTIEDR